MVPRVKRRTERLTCCCGGSELEARTREREDGGQRRRGLAAEAERERKQAVAGWRGREWWSGGARPRSSMALWWRTDWIGDFFVLVFF